MKTEVYQHAKYYEIAFGFINAQKQANLFEKFISQYSKIEVKSVLDIGCGTALQLRELAKRGYESIGLDLNSEMLSYLKEAARKEGIDIKTFEADMVNFKLDAPVDFAYIMMGSIIYLKSNNELLEHLVSASDSMKSGGLYLIENLAMDWTGSDFWKPQTWTEEKDGIRVTATYQIEPLNPLLQTIRQTIKLEVNDNGQEISLIDTDDLKLIFPQEFVSIVEMQGKFEFIGFFERDSTERLDFACADNIVVLRKR